MYYAADNLYGSDTSVGFVNTWRVLAFTDKESRDAFVEQGDMSTRAIKRRDISRYIDNVKPFSGQAVCLDTYANSTLDIDGLIGMICVTCPDSYQGIKKLRA